MWWRMVGGYSEVGGSAAGRRRRRRGREAHSPAPFGVQCSDSECGVLQLCRWRRHYRPQRLGREVVSERWVAYLVQQCLPCLSHLVQQCLQDAEATHSSHRLVCNLVLPKFVLTNCRNCISEPMLLSKHWTNVSRKLKINLNFKLNVASFVC